MMTSVDSSSAKGRTLLALTPLVLAILVWAGWLIPQRPYSGLLGVTEDGTIESLDPAGPSVSVLQEGDVIVSIDGEAFRWLHNPFGGLRVGDQVSFLVERGDEALEAVVTLSASPTSRLLGGFAPLLLAFAFVLGSAVVLWMAPAGATSRVFYLFCHAAGAALGFALLGVVRYPWGSHLFYVLLLFSGPLMLHLHLSLVDRLDRPAWRRLLWLFYAGAGVGSLPFLAWPPGVLSTLQVYELLYTGARLFVAVPVLLAVGLLVIAATRGADAQQVRRKIRPVAVAAGLVLALVVGLTLIPDAVAQSPILPYRLAFLVLLVLPAAYGYTIARLPPSHA